MFKSEKNLTHLNFTFCTHMHEPLCIEKSMDLVTGGTNTDHFYLKHWKTLDPNVPFFSLGKNRVAFLEHKIVFVCLK